MKLDPIPKYVKMKLSDGTTIRGKLNLYSDMKHMDRLSDYFITGENPFIVLYDVKTMGSDNVMIVNKSHIVWVIPDD
jgi:small nuclear ribonucleoprotein (snRNP)-like protein